MALFPSNFHTPRERASLAAALKLCESDPLFKARFKRERKAYAKRRRELIRHENNRPCAKAARARYFETPRGRERLELSQFKQKLRLRYALVIGDLA